MIERSEIVKAIRDLRLSRQTLCVHASLRSFGATVAGGPERILDALLEEGCTVVVPTFSWAFGIPPPPHLRPPRNGCHYKTRHDERPTKAVYSPMSLEIDVHLGVFAATVLTHPDHVRGDHPVNSFTAVGPMAQELIREQSPLDVYAPLQALCDSNGSVVLMGVQLESLTLVHLAERKAGRNLFRRWANGRGGEPIMVETGGCSRGFGRLEPVVAALGRERLVGRSRWRVFPAAATLEAAAHAIRTSPAITHCDDPHCERCNDALLGGPILPPD